MRNRCRPGAQLHGLAATARIANIPSVICNVWLGIALAVVAGGGTHGGHFLGRVTGLGLAGVSLYLAGNFLNDWADRDWDAVHRPERALPRALFPARVYRIVAVACGMLACGCAAAVNVWCLMVALLIGCCIIVYTRVHKRAAWSVIPMGLCRAMLPVLGFAGFVFPGEASPAGWPGVMTALAACATGLFCHIAGLSLSARNESLAAPPAGAMRFATLLFPGAAASVLVASWLVFALPLGFRALGLLPYGLWIARCLTVGRRPVSRQVADLLAGIPLVDWIILLPLALTLGPNGHPASLPAISLLLPPLAFLAAKFLQKFTPAT